MKTLAWVLWAAVATMAQAQEPIALNGLAPGMGIAEVEKLYPATKLDCRVNRGRTLCQYSRTEAQALPGGLDALAGETVAQWSFVLDADRRIDVVAAHFARDAFQGIVASLERQYGAAYQVRLEIPGGIGAEAEWRRGGSLLGVKQAPGRAIVMLTTLPRGKALANEQGFTPPSP